MEIFIGTQFSKELTFEFSREIVNSFEKLLNDYFAEKKYHSEINKVYIGFLCISKDFETVILLHPLRVLKKKCAIDYEIKLDFDTVFQSKDLFEDLRNYISTSLVDQSKEIFERKKIKDFDTERFISDLSDCLIS